MVQCISLVPEVHCGLVLVFPLNTRVHVFDQDELIVESSAEQPPSW